MKHRHSRGVSSLALRISHPLAVFLLLAAFAAALGLFINRPATAADDSPSAPAATSVPDLLWMKGAQAGGVGKAAISPDGRLLATADYAEVLLWDYADTKLVRTIPVPGIDAVRCIKFTPDGLHVIAGGTWIPGWDAKTLRMFRVADGELVREFTATRDVRSIALSNDGRHLAATIGGGEPHVALFDVATGGQLRSFGPFAANAVAFSRDGYVAAAGADQFGDPPTVTVWRASDGVQVAKLGGLNFITDSVAFSPDGRYLAAGDWASSNGVNGKVTVWLAPAFVQVHTLTAPLTGSIYSVAFSPDSQYVAAGGTDTVVNVWHLPDGALTKTVGVEINHAIWNIVFSDNDTFFASGAQFTSGVFRLSDGSRLRTFGDHRVFVTAAAYSPDSAHLITSNGHNSNGGPWWVEMSRASDGAHERDLGAHNDIINAVAFSPDGARVASASGAAPPDTRDTRVFISPIAAGAALLILPGHAGGTITLAFSPDGQLLATGGRDNAAVLWRVSDGTVVRTIRGHTNWVQSVAFSPDGQLLATGSGDSKVKLWRVSDGALVRTIDGTGFPVNTVAFAPDGATLALGAYDTIQLRRVSDGALVRTINLEPGFTNLSNVVYSRDGSVLGAANGSFPPTVRFWRVADGTLVKSYNRETGWTQPPALAVAPDGATFAMGRYDAVIEVARFPSTDAAAVNVAHRSQGAAVTVSSSYDGRFPASALNDGDRRGLNWGAGGGWNDGTPNSYPDWVQVEFAGPRTLQELDVFTVQDNYASPSEPTAQMTFTKYGVTNFRAEYWTGSAWATLPGAQLTSNRQIWSRFTFAPVTTSKIRLVIDGALDGYSRLVEVEAWGTVPSSTRLNVAAAANGATAAASSSYDSRFPAASVINSDRRGVNWGNGGGWNDATGNAYPDWLEVTFNGAKTIEEIDVFTVQDNFAAPVEPTEALTFTRYGVTAFEVQHWNGSAWATVPGGAVTNNNSVWRKVTFAPVTTTKIRVLVNNGLDGYSRLVEVEAY